LNSEYGLVLNSSSNNSIYNNHFNNTNNVWDDGFNTWNITKQAGINIFGGYWLGGNRWSDYTGRDTNRDGLGNTKTPYNCSGNIVNGGDYLPLVTPGGGPGTGVIIAIAVGVIALSTGLIFIFRRKKQR